MASHGLDQDVPSGGCEDECDLRGELGLLVGSLMEYVPVETQIGQGTYLRLHSKLLVEIIAAFRTAS